MMTGGDPDANLVHPTEKKTVFCLVLRVLVQSVATSPLSLS